MTPTMLETRHWRPLMSHLKKLRSLKRACLCATSERPSNSSGEYSFGGALLASRRD